MFKVVICEDNEAQRNHISTIVNELGDRYDNAIEIALSTGFPNDVIDYVNTTLNKEMIYIIDIDLNNNLNGFDVCKIIRKIDLDSYIIFISGHIELSLYVFKYNIRAFDFIDKGEFINLRDKLDGCFEKILNETKIKSKMSFSFKLSNKMIAMDYDDIMFFETAGVHKLRIHTKNGRYEFYDTIKNISSSLNKDFVRVNKSYIVNIKNVIEIDKIKKNVVMKNMEQCYMSRIYINDVEKAWDSIYS